MKTVRSQARAGPTGRTPDTVSRDQNPKRPSTERRTTFVLYEDNELQQSTAGARVEKRP